VAAIALLIMTMLVVLTPPGRRLVGLGRPQRGARTEAGRRARGPDPRLPAGNPVDNADRELARVRELAKGADDALTLAFYPAGTMLRVPDPSNTKQSLAYGFPGAGVTLKGDPTPRREWEQHTFSLTEVDVSVAGDVLREALGRAPRDAAWIWVAALGARSGGWRWIVQLKCTTSKCPDALWYTASGEFLEERAVK
jgi:hypothetical protein